jgi:hypothetical protein
VMETSELTSLSIEVAPIVRRVVGEGLLACRVDQELVLPGPLPRVYPWPQSLSTRL